MHPDLLNNAGVALILFLQGLAMAQLIFGGEPGIDPSADHVLSPVSVVRLRAAASHFSSQNRGIQVGEVSPIGQP